MNLEIVSGLLGPNANKAKATVCNVATDSKVTTDKCMCRARLQIVLSMY